MSRREWALLLLPKLPALDPKWEPELQNLWFRAFWRLREMLAGEGEGE